MIKGQLLLLKEKVASTGRHITKTGVYFFSLVAELVRPSFLNIHKGMSISWEASTAAISYRQP